jgi:hypothetical protein
MKNILLTTLLFLCYFSYCQERPKTFLDRLILGSSLTIIPDDSYKLPNSSGTYNRWEYTWNTNLAIDISRRWRFGFQYLSIYAKKYASIKENFFITGSFLQYNFIPKNLKRYRIYVETSYNLGNYCTCGEEEPYKKDNLKYLGLGAGADFRITDWLHFDFAVANYDILNKILGKYNYTQYIFGFEFALPLKK